MNTRQLLGFITALIILTMTNACRKNSDYYGDSGDGLFHVRLAGVEAKEDNAGDAKKLASNSKRTATINREDYIQTRTISLDNGLELEATLIDDALYSAVASQAITDASDLEVPKLAATETVTKVLDPGTKFRVLVYEGNSLTTSKIFTYGDGDDAFPAEDIETGKTYTFVAFSSNSKTDVPAVENENSLSDAKLKDVNTELMYFKKDLYVEPDATNYLEAVLVHQFSQITATFYLDDATDGYIQSVQGVKFKPARSSATLSLTNGDIDWGNVSDDGAAIAFPSITGDIRTITSSPSLIISPYNDEAYLEIGDLTINGDSKINIRTKDDDPYYVDPGHRYNLFLKFHNPCTEVVLGAAFDWSLETKVNLGAYDDLLFEDEGGADWSHPSYHGQSDEKRAKVDQRIQDIKNNKGITIVRADENTNNYDYYVVQEFEASNADYGFVFDISNMDNSFSMTINGDEISVKEIQFQNDESRLPMNILFSNGDYWKSASTLPDNDAYIETVWDMRGTVLPDPTQVKNNKPSLRVVIPPADNAVPFILGSRSADGGNLESLNYVTQDVDNYRNKGFNIRTNSGMPVTWHKDAPNTVVIKQLITGQTFMKGYGYAKRRCD